MGLLRDVVTVTVKKMEQRCGCTVNNEEKCHV